MKKTKITNPNIPLPTLAKPCGVKERLRRLCEEEGREAIPITQQFIENMAEEIIEWADKEDSFLLSEFYNPRGYSDQRLLNWKNKYPVFAAAYQYAKETIGARRIKKRIIETNCDFTLSEYSPEWDAKENKLHQRKIELASIKKNSQEVPTTFIIEGRKAENCPEVPYAPSKVKIEIDDDKS